MLESLGEELAPWRAPEREGDRLVVLVRHLLPARESLDPAHVRLGGDGLAAASYRLRLVLVNDANTPREVTLFAVPTAAGVATTSLTETEAPLVGTEPVRLAVVRCVPHSETPVEVVIAAPAGVVVSVPEEL